MTQFTLRSILIELLDTIGLKQKVYIRRLSFKRQIASVSFKSNFIRINKKLTNDLNYDLLRYIILHELIHLKLGHPYHDKSFYQEINRYLLKPVEWYDRQLRQYPGIHSSRYI